MFFEELALPLDIPHISFKKKSYYWDTKSTQTMYHVVWGILFCLILVDRQSRNKQFFSVKLYWINKLIQDFSLKIYRKHHGCKKIVYLSNFYCALACCACFSCTYSVLFRRYYSHAIHSTLRARWDYYGETKSQ